MITSLLTPTHIAIPLTVLLLIVGPKRIPETGRALGSGIREFKQALTGHDADSTDSAGTDVVTTSDTQPPSRREGPT